MGHWLDGLLGGMQIEWDGTRMTPRAVLSFGEQFRLADDPAGNRTLVELRFMGLDGDVTGDTDENRVTTISGNEDSATVAMRAQSLAWDADVSEGIAEITISGGELDAGALAIRHGFQEVFVGVSNEPRIGNATSVLLQRGGQRFQTRYVDVSATTLDTTHTDMVVHVLASAERGITLPPATDGRTVIFLITGASLVTIKRRGTEFINGSASNYLVPFADACVVLSSFGGNWIARSFADAAGLGGGDAEVPITRRIDTAAPLTGGGDISVDRTISIDPAAFVPPARTVTATPPLTGGGDLSANRTIGIDTSGLVATTRTVATAAPLTGGGPLDTDRTIGIDPAAYVAPSRTITVTAPLTGGGPLSSDVTIGINPSGFVGVARLINTTAPLTGGGALSGDLTLAISAATAAAMGVVQLAGNLAGSAAVPLVKGLTADTITVQNADGSQKGAWTTAGLRVGDNNAPSEKLDVLGNINASGFLKVGTNPAASGAIRIPNNQAIVARNSTNSVDYQIAIVDSAGKVILGQSFQGSSNTEVQSGTSGSVKIAPGGTAMISSFSSGNTLGTSSTGNSLNGSQYWQMRSTSVDYSVAADCVILVDTTAAVRVVTMPLHQSGRFVLIKRKAGTNNVQINVSGKVDGQAVSSLFLMTSTAIPGMQPFIEMFSDGTDWFITRYYSIQINLP